MSGGRPTDYRPEYCERIVELGREGYSVAQMAAALDVARQTLRNWAADHPEFLAAFTRAKDLSLCWWEEKAQSHIENTSFNTSLWSRSMAARFPEDYTERQKRELTGANGGPVEQVTRVEIVAVEAGNE